MPQSQTQKLIIGLGNPEPRYLETRHNLGWQVLDELAAIFNLADQKWSKHNQAEALYLSGTRNDVPYFLIKPITYMNRSGGAIQQLMHYYKINPENLWVIYDDIDLALGQIRIRTDGASAGHRGVESIITALGQDNFLRFRLGIGPVPKGFDPADFVLGKFAPTEEVAVTDLRQRAAQAVIFSFEHSPEKVMNKFN